MRISSASWFKAIFCFFIYGWLFKLFSPLAKETEDLIVLWILSLLALPFPITLIHHLLAIVLDWLTTWWPQWLPWYSELQGRHIHAPKQRRLLFPAWDSWREGLSAIVVHIAASIITAILGSLVVLLFIGRLVQNAQSELLTNLSNQIEGGAQIALDPDQGASQTGAYVFLVAFIIIIIWLTSAAAIYQNDSSVRERRAEKIAKAVKQAAAAKRKASKTSKSKQTQWYVFRSGETIGPYTKKQLQLEQKITARTSVRREDETDWTKAGEIPELADFLNTKA